MLKLLNAYLIAHQICNQPGTDVRQRPDICQDVLTRRSSSTIPNEEKYIWRHFNHESEAVGMGLRNCLQAMQDFSNIGLTLVKQSHLICKKQFAKCPLRHAFHH